MEFQKKKYTFRGFDGFAGYRHGETYELELATTEATDEQPAEIVVVNPVSRLWWHLSKAGFADTWRKE